MSLFWTWEIASWTNIYIYIYIYIYILYLLYILDSWGCCCDTIYLNGINEWYPWDGMWKNVW